METKNQIILPIQKKEIGQIQSQGFHLNSSNSQVSSPILSKAFTQPNFKMAVVQNQPVINNPIHLQPSTSSQKSANALNIIPLNSQPQPSSLKILEEKSLPTLSISPVPKPITSGKPTILESKQKPEKTKPEIVWRVCLQTLPTGWKTRTLYWTDREKHFYLSPEGKIFSSRKSVMEFMQQCGTYTDNDFDKVRKGMNRKRKKKSDNDQWVPVKKKPRRKQNKSSATNLVTTDKSSDDCPDESSINDIEVNSLDTPSDEQQASIKPCTVRIEKLE